MFPNFVNDFMKEMNFLFYVVSDKQDIFFYYKMILVIKYVNFLLQVTSFHQLNEDTEFLKKIFDDNHNGKLDFTEFKRLF